MNPPQRRNRRKPPINMGLTEMPEAAEVHARIRDTIAALMVADNPADAEWMDRIVPASEHFDPQVQMNYLSAGLGSALGHATAFIIAIAAELDVDPLALWADWCAHMPVEKFSL